MDMDYDKWFSFTIVDDEQEEMNDLSTKPQPVAGGTNPSNFTSSSRPNNINNPASSAFEIGGDDTSTTPPFSANNISANGNNNLSILPTFDTDNNSSILTTFPDNNSSFPRNASSVALNSDIT
jgi:hypothetical protein